MARRPLLRQHFPWRKALSPDADLAGIEGLAAGTGLLTGDIARHASVEAAPCPTCSGPGDVVVIDLVARSVSRRCQLCGHRWDTDEPARSSTRH